MLGLQAAERSRADADIETSRKRMMYHDYRPFKVYYYPQERRVCSRYVHYNRPITANIPPPIAAAASGTPVARARFSFALDEADAEAEADAADAPPADPVLCAV